MAVRTRSEMRRIDQAQTVHDKRSFGIAIFTIVVLFFSLVYEFDFYEKSNCKGK